MVCFMRYCPGGTRILKFTMLNQIVGQLPPIHDTFGFTNFRSITLVKKRPLSFRVLTRTVTLAKRKFYSKTVEVAKLQYAHRASFESEMT